MKQGKKSPPWSEKMKKPAEPSIVEAPLQWCDVPNGKMLIPTPMLIDELVRKVPRGRLITVNSIRDSLADRFGADITCPLTTGIFLNIVANAAEEALAAGAKRVTPYWRVLKEGGKLNPKFPGGCESQAEKLQAEQQQVEKGRGKESYIVKGYQEKLFSPG